MLLDHIRYGFLIPKPSSFKCDLVNGGQAAGPKFHNHAHTIVDLRRILPMQEKTIYTSGAVLLILTWCTMSYANPPDRRETHVLPSISTAEENFTGGMSWGIACFGIRTGILRDCFISHHTLFGVEESENRSIKSLACVIEPDGTIFPDTCANGGHLHEHTPSFVRPLIHDQNNPASKLRYDGGDLDPNNKFNVSGNLTPNEWRRIEYDTPDNAGIFYWEARIVPPPCFFLPQFCGFVGPGAQDDGTVIWDGTIEASYRDLTQLPDVPSLYRKVRGGDPAAPNPDLPDKRHENDAAFAGDPVAIAAMILIASEYKIATKKLLRPNDMSLPLGGLFDIVGKWTTSHFEHRFGRDIDVNRAPLRFASDGSELPPVDVQCENDKEFVEEVNKVLVPVPGRIVDVTPPGGTLMKFQTAVICEKLLNSPILGLKHIDVTAIIAKQSTP